jgi:hypothetical protein
VHRTRRSSGLHWRLRATSLSRCAKVFWKAIHRIQTRFPASTYLLPATQAVGTPASVVARGRRRAAPHLAQPPGACVAANEAPHARSLEERGDQGAAGGLRASSHWAVRRHAAVRDPRQARDVASQLKQCRIFVTQVTISHQPTTFLLVQSISTSAVLQPNFLAPLTKYAWISAPGRHHLPWWACWCHRDTSRASVAACRQTLPSRHRRR